MNIRRWIIAIHRDVGYFFTGFIIIFATSGIALNHIDHWNPNFIIERRLVEIELPDASEKVTQEHIFIAREREMLFVPESLEIDVDEDDVYEGKLKARIAFTLGKGSYATMVIKALFEH